MKTNARDLALAIGCFLLLTGTQCFGQERTGGVIVRIPNGPPSRCINASTDRVWLTLYRVILTKNRGWFTSSNQVEIIANVQVKTSPQSPQNLSYPLSTEVNLRDYRTGQVSLPVEYTLVSGLSLKQGTVTYTGFGVDITLVNVKSANKLGGALTALAQITGSNKVPIPESPFTQTGGYLLSFASEAVKRDIDNQNNDDKYKTSSLALNFDPTGTCADSASDGLGFETTGTKAVVLGDGARGEGYVPIESTNDYCWIADTQPAFVLKAAKKISGIPCSDAAYTPRYKPITNNYVAFLLQKRTISGQLGGRPAVEKDISDAKKLCDVLGVADCVAARRQ